MPTTDRADLLHAILDPANFGDDALRLAYADLLHADGDDARGEFIEVQCTLYHKPDCPDWCDGDPKKCKVEALRLRERELLALQCPYIALPGGVRWPLEVDGSNWHRGFVHTVRCTLADWYGGKCGCWGVNSHGQPQAAIFCPLCKGTGKVEGHGKAIVRAQPVEAVPLSGLEPEPHIWAGGTNYSWYVTGFQDDRVTVPEELFDLLPDARTGLSGGRKAYPTRAAALAALSAAALAWARA